MQIDNFPKKAGVNTMKRVDWNEPESEETSNETDLDPYTRIGRRRNVDNDAMEMWEEAFMEGWEDA